METFTKRVWMAVAAVACVLLAVWLLAWLLYGVLIIFAGLLLSMFLMQVSQRLSRLTGLPYKGAYATVVVSLAAAAAAMVVVMGAQIVQGATDFVEQLWEVGEDLQQRMQDQEWWQTVERLTRGAGDILTGEQAIMTATVAVTTVFWAVAGTVLVLVLGFYYGLRPDWYRAGLLSLVPPQRRPRVGEVLDMIGETMWHWFVGRLVSMLLIGAAWTAGLWLLDVPMAIPLGVFAGLMEIIPNIGPFIALVPALLFSFQEGPQAALYVLLLFFVLQSIEGYVLVPLIEQRQVALPPGFTLANQLLFGLWAGFLGLLLATPIAVVISILLREFYIKDTLGGRPVPGSDGGQRS